jgi:hypothetical protein
MPLQWIVDDVLANRLQRYFAANDAIVIVALPDGNAILPDIKRACLVTADLKEPITAPSYIASFSRRGEACLARSVLQSLMIPCTWFGITTYSSNVTVAK